MSSQAGGWAGRPLRLEGNGAEDVRSRIRRLRLEATILGEGDRPGGRFPLSLFFVGKDQGDAGDKRKAAHDRGQRDGLLL